MKRLLIFASAILLGVVVMLLPIFLLRYSGAVTFTHTMRGSENELTGWVERAHTYGQMDIGPVPFPWSLIYAGLILTTGLLAALGIVLFIKKRGTL